MHIDNNIIYLGDGIQSDIWLCHVWELLYLRTSVSGNIFDPDAVRISLF